MTNKWLFLFLVPVLGYAASPERVYEKSKDKVVKISVVLEDGRQGSCSGAFINEDGFVLTCAHCFRHPGIIKIFVKQDNEEVGYGVVTRLDAMKDLALVATLAHDTPYFKLGRSLKRGQGVLLFGSPLGLCHSMSVGWVENFVDGFIQHEVVVHSAATNPGNSGGPLVDLHGQLIGLGEGVVMMNPFIQAEGMSLAINIEDIRQFLEGE